MHSCVYETSLTALQSLSQCSYFSYFRYACALDVYHVAQHFMFICSKSVGFLLRHQCSSVVSQAHTHAPRTSTLSEFLSNTEQMLFAKHQCLCSNRFTAVDQWMVPHSWHLAHRISASTGQVCDHGSQPHALFNSAHRQDTHCFNKKSARTFDVGWHHYTNLGTAERSEICSVITDNFDIWFVGG